MNPRIKELWVEALESGKYEQGLNALHQIDENGRETFCCLGVLCDLAVKEEVIPAPRKRDCYFSYGRELQEEVLPREIVEWAEIKEGKYKGTPEIEVCNELSDVTKLNDGGMPFKKIARLIHEQL